jgi:hypothetical protein
VGLGQLTPGERLIVGGAAAFAVSLFLPWYGITVFTGLRIDNLGWDYVLGGVLPMLLLAAAAGLSVVPGWRPAAVRDTLPAVLRDLRRDATAAAALIVLLRTIVADGGLDRRYGIVVALLAALVAGAGAVLSPAVAAQPRGGSTQP